MIRKKTIWFNCEVMKLFVFGRLKFAEILIFVRVASRFELIMVTLP